MKSRIFSMMKARVNEAEFGSQLAMYYRKPFLKTLFSGRKALTHGFIGQVGACFIAYWATGDIAYAAFAMLAALVLAFRQVQFALYDRRSAYLMSDASTEDEINRWYLWYIAASSMTSCVVGSLTGYSIVFHPGTWATAIPLALTLGTMVAVVGRNFGNGVNVTMIVLCSFVPCITAFLYLAIVGEQYFIGLGGAALLLPFMMATRDMARAVKEQLNEALTSKQEADLLREQFYNAVTNMPNGLVMVERDGSIKFANGPAKKMFGVPDGINVDGMPIESLFAVGKRRTLSADDRAAFKNSIYKLFDGTSHTEKLIFSEDFQVEFTIRQEASDKMNLRLHKEDGFVLVCEDVTMRVIAEQKVRYSANYDGLSDIPNRSHMRHLVEEAKSLRTRGKNLNIALGLEESAGLA